MKKINRIEELQELILLLELKQVEDKILLKKEFKDTYEGLKPINLIKSTIHEFLNLPDLKGDFLDTSISLTTGYLSKKMIVGSSHNPFKQIIGNLIQMGVTNLISKNSQDIRMTIANLFKKRKNG